MSQRRAALDGNGSWPRGWRLGCLLALLGLVSSESGCTVRSLEGAEAEQSVNQCDSELNCPGGRCVDGRCVAGSGDIKRVLFEVVPPTVTSGGAAPSISSVRYLLDKVLPQNTSEPLDLELRPIAHVKGEVNFTSITTEDCKLDEVESLTLQARFTPSEQLLGLAGTTYTTEATHTRDASKAWDGKLGFSVNIPPGYYDVYLQTTIEHDTCRANPRLFRRRAIGVSASEPESNGDAPVDEVHIPLTLPKPSKLTLRVRFPEQERSLAGWKVALLDSTSGFTLSTVGVLQPPVGDEHRVNLEYSSVVYSGNSVPAVPAETEIVRLSPPSDVVAPTLYAARIGLELFTANEAEIALERLPDIVSVVGHIRLNPDSNVMACAREATEQSESAQDASPCSVPFSVQLVSSAGDGETSTFNDTIPKGMIASYQQTVEADSDLRFYVDVPAGEYRAIALPRVDDERPWAISEDAWVIGNEDRVVHGKTVNVMPRSRVVGQVLSPSAAAMNGFGVQLTASPRELVGSGVEETVLRANTVLELTRRESYIPRATSADTAGDGSFQVFADQGVFDLSVRPESGSGFAWLVRPNVTVLPGGGQATQDLGALRLPVPVRYAGSVSSLNLNGRVADALIRVYAYLDEDGAVTDQDAHSAIQVAETRADAEGQFELLLPSTLAATR